MKKITKMLKSLITKNLILKVSSLILAATIWLAVVNVNDPTKTITIYNVPITFIDEEVIHDNNQVYEAIGNKYVNITVSGRRSVIGDLSYKNFVAQASLKEMSMTNAIPVTVFVRNKSLENKITIESQSVEQMQITVEDVIDKNYTVENVITGNVAKGYVLGTVTMKKDNVSITAPKSVHDKISKVVLNVDVTDMSKDYEKKYKVILLDKDGNKIGSDEDVVLDSKKIQVSVQVLKLVTVPIVVEPQGELPEGFEIKEITTNIEEIMLVGEETVVDAIDSITIAGDDVDISGQTGYFEKEIDLVKYIPAGVIIRGDGILNVSIDIEGDITKEYEIPLKDIQMINAGQAYDVEIISESVTLQCRGKRSAFEDVNADSFEVTIDLKGLKEGKNTVTAQVTGPEGVDVANEIKIKVKLVEKQ